MTVHLAPKANDLCKFSIVISKKASKKAVTRNRYRRQLKEWYRTHRLHEFGHDMIIVAKAKLTPQPATTIHHDFSRVHRWLKTHCTIDWFLIKLTNYYVLLSCAKRSAMTSEKQFMIKQTLCWFISQYQRYISPLTPPTCRFYPSCSEYTKQSIQTLGVCHGSWQGLKQLLRCHPFSSGV